MNREPSHRFPVPDGLTDAEVEEVIRAQLGEACVPQDIADQMVPDMVAAYRAHEEGEL